MVSGSLRLDDEPDASSNSPLACIVTSIRFSQACHLSTNSQKIDLFNFGFCFEVDDNGTEAATCWAFVKHLVCENICIKV